RAALLCDKRAGTGGLKATSKRRASGWDHRDSRYRSGAMQIFQRHPRRTRAHLMHPETIPYDEALAQRQSRLVAVLRRWSWRVALTAPLAAYLIGFLLPLSLMIGFAFRP